MPRAEQRPTYPGLAGCTRHAAKDCGQTLYRRPLRPVEAPEKKDGMPCGATHESGGVAYSDRPQKCGKGISPFKGQG